MTDDFQTVIDKFVVNTEAKMLAVTRTAIQSVVDEAQTTVSQGGKMRVDTGFLRSTGVGQIGGMPSGPSQRNKDVKYPWEADPVGVVLASLKMGDVFFFGWTAKYAKDREVFDGFVESAAQNWQIHVNNAVKRLKK